MMIVSRKCKRSYVRREKWRRRRWTNTIAAKLTAVTKARMSKPLKNGRRRKRISKKQRKKRKRRKKKKRGRIEKKERGRKEVRAAAVDDDLYKPNRSRKETKEKVEIDEEDEGNLKDLRGYKKTSDGRTTSYFNNELDEHTKSLIGNITPKRIDSVGSLDATVTQGSSGTVSRNDSTASTNSNTSNASVWNTAGTWEEKDMSSDVKSRLTDLCKQSV